MINRLIMWYLRNKCDGRIESGRFIAVVLPKIMFEEGKGK